MRKVKLSREELTCILEIYESNVITPLNESEEIILGVLAYDFILPARKRLLTDAKNFSFTLRRHQLLALIQYFKAITPEGAYEKVRVYNLIDQTLKQL